MEIKTKEMKQATYQVACVQGDYSVNANVTIGNDGKVINMDGGVVALRGKHLASFGIYGDNANVNYSGLSLDEKNAVNTLIEQFKQKIQA